MLNVEAVMLFNSYVFLLIFLPLVIVGFSVMIRLGGRHAGIVWLTIASGIFYGWWDPRQLPAIYMMILINFLLGRWLRIRRGTPTARPLLALGVTLNLLWLGYFKYAGFLAANLNPLFGSHWEPAAIALPIGISFYTFQQIAYLVDVAREPTEDYSPVDYALFVTFFPQLIAGPIVHHKEMLPQFARPSSGRFSSRDFTIGLTIFAIGLGKKLLLADPMAAISDPIFAVAESGRTPGFDEAWRGALAYTLFIYFDFSGYSDMAIGLARIFGIRLPINFRSPYKAWDIVEFWRRWHITLSRFLRDYLYIGLLGGNRRGRSRRDANLLMTMILGGLWHGASWTFVIWGLIHGIYLIVNHAWRRVLGAEGTPGPLGRWSGRALTFVLIVVAWVFFRAESLQGALAFLDGMTRPEAPDQFDKPVEPGALFLDPFLWDWIFIVALMAIALFAPNTQQIMRRYRPALHVRRTELADDCPALLKGLCWRPNAVWAVLIASLLIACLASLSKVSKFIYFQF